jgi:hypothetical protein
MRVTPAKGIDFSCVGRINREFDNQSIGGRAIQGTAIAVIRFTDLLARSLYSAEQFLISSIVHFECDVMESADLRRYGRLAFLIDLVIGEREKCQGTAVAQKV